MLSAGLDGASVADSSFHGASTGDSLKSLAAAILRLSDADRVTLLTMMGDSENGAQGD